MKKNKYLEQIKIFITLYIAFLTIVFSFILLVFLVWSFVRGGFIENFITWMGVRLFMGITFIIALYNIIKNNKEITKAYYETEKEANTN